MHDNKNLSNVISSFYSRRWGASACGLLLVILFTVLTLGCSQSGIPAAPKGDATLVLGQQLYARSCASCHGPSGKGGAGPKIAGVMEIRFPNIADHIAVIANGRKGTSMPAFANSLTSEEIEAIARYEREVLK